MNHAEGTHCRNDALARALAESDPGPRTIEALAALGESGAPGLSAAGHTDAVAAWHKVVSWATARMYIHAAALARTAGTQQAEMEISCALRLSAHATDTLLADAAALSGPLSETGAALAAGAISPAHAHAIAEAVDLSELDPAAVVIVQAKALPRARSAPVADLRRTLTRAVASADPEAAERRHELRKAARHVRLYPIADGMAVFSAEIEAVTAAKLAATVTDHARTLRAQDKAARGESIRTLDAARADALVQLVAAGHAALAADGGAPTATIESTIYITVPLSTLMGLDQAPGELSGYGTVSAGQLRVAALSAGAVWRRLVTDDVTGAVLDVGRTRYRPGAAIADTVRARHPRCVFPTCPRPAAGCDLDHNQPFDRSGAGQGGATAVDNLGPVCRFHHNAKTHGGWNWTVDPATSDITWTSPTGHRYVKTEERPPTR